MTVCISFYMHLCAISFLLGCELSFQSIFGLNRKLNIFVLFGGEWVDLTFYYSYMEIIFFLIFGGWLQYTATATYVSLCRKVNLWGCWIGLHSFSMGLSMKSKIRPLFKELTSGFIFYLRTLMYWKISLHFIMSYDIIVLAI